jgi:multicomponent Na+:H+ antiporter subunit B
MLNRYTALLFAGGFGFLLYVLASGLPFGDPSMPVSHRLLHESVEVVGAANIVASIVLAYRAIDTLVELAILFAAAMAGGLILGHSRGAAKPAPPAGFVLRAGAELMFPLLIVLGLYVVLHGHLAPGGGFQGGAVLAAAFVVPVLARPGRLPSPRALGVVQGLAGAAFVATGLAALLYEREFLAPLLAQGRLGTLISAGTLPLLNLAVGLKVGAELAGLLVRIAAGDGEPPR